MPFHQKRMTGGLTISGILPVAMITIYLPARVNGHDLETECLLGSFPVRRLHGARLETRTPTVRVLSPGPLPLGYSRIARLSFVMRRAINERLELLDITVSQRLTTVVAYHMVRKAGIGPATTTSPTWDATNALLSELNGFLGGYSL